jgi:hypothetical protein
MDASMDLAAVGSASLGWRRGDALRVIEEAREYGLVILGGDVWWYGTGRISPSADRDNWSAERTGIKPTVLDVERSANRARDYVTSYPAPPDGSQPVFELVFGERCIGR